MNTNIYERNLRKLLSADESEWTPDVHCLVEVAYQIDEDCANIVYESKQLAEKWMRFADDVSAGQTFGEPSPQRQWDITRRCAALEARRRLFIDSLRCCVSREKQEEYWAAVANDFKNVGV